MNAQALQALTRKHTAMLDGIGDLMEVNKITEIDGEILLLYLAGLSAGQRQAAINEKNWLKPIAIAWAFAAENGGD